MTLLDVARGYVERGWCVVPIPHKHKKPVVKDWPSLRLTAAELPATFNGAASNIGVLLGAPSGYLVDVDLDCAEALLLAPSLLPKTLALFGRASKPRSHRLYIAALKTREVLGTGGARHERGRGHACRAPFHGRANRLSRLDAPHG